MRPYGIVVFPEGNNAIVHHAAGEVGLVPKSHDDRAVEQGTGYPTSVFFETEHGRNEEMDELLRIYPNIMFCPITLTTGKKTHPDPTPTQFTIDQRGVLPA